MKKIIVLCILISLQLFKLAAQQIPTIIPPSPQAQAFMRYGEIPVDYSTGVPSISIPLYTIKGKKLELPISISYHASGIKVNDVASEVGLGWMMTCGGMISRTIYGKADEEYSYSKTYKNASQIINYVTSASPVYDDASNRYTNTSNIEDYFATNFEAEDPLSDRFYYSLPNGTSGVFILDSSNSNNVITLPFRPWKFEKTITTSSYGFNRIEKFKITDDNGDVYMFSSFNTNGNTTEWYLTKMTDVGNTESIDFKYIIQNQRAYRNSFVLSTRSQDYTYSCMPSGQIPTSTISSSTPSINEYNTPILNSVTSSNAIIDFSYIKDRTDFTQANRLTEIKISSANTPSTTLKTIKLEHKYFGANATDYRLGLDKLFVNTSRNERVQQYSFIYEASSLPPYAYKMTTPRFNEDYWGYSNGSNSPTLIQSNFIENSSDKAAFGANREADDGTYSRACMIKEIKYPTGGRTVFQFERNYSTNIYKYKSTNSAGYLGGFRIGSIINYNQNNVIENIKTYEYGGTQAKGIDNSLFSYTQLSSLFHKPDVFSSCWILVTEKNVMSDPLLPLEVAPGLPVMYTKVTEYNGTKTNNSGKTVYEYDFPYSPNDYFSHDAHPLMWEEPRFYTATHYDKGNFRPEMISKTDYLFDGTNYKPVYKTMNSYATLFTKEYLTGIKLTRPHTFRRSSDEVYTGTVGIGNNGSLIMDFIQSYVAIDTKAYQETHLLTKTKSYTYNPTDSTKYVMGTTDLEYEPNYTQLTKQTTSTSVSDKNKITQFTYPFNYSTTPYTNMVGLNNVTPVIEQSEYSGTNFLQATRTNYSFFQNNSIIAPSSVDLKTGSNNYETRLIYGSYDTKGNPQYLCKDDATKEVYLWSYNKQYPVAKIEGLTYAQVVAQYPQTSIDNLANTANPTVDQLNAIRTALASQLALVTTYTYSPLIGIVTATDPRGVTTTYTYDAFSRLIYIKNHDNKILNEYRYHYSNQ